MINIKRKMYGGGRWKRRRMRKKRGGGPPPLFKRGTVMVEWGYSGEVGEEEERRMPSSSSH